MTDLPFPRSLPEFQKLSSDNVACAPKDHLPDLKTTLPPVGDGGAEGWRPIETAPKDGKWVLLAWSGGVTCAHWQAEFEYRGGGYRGAWTDETVANWGMEETSDLGDDFTHWMPLPAAPGDGAGRCTASSHHADDAPGTNQNNVSPSPIEGRREEIARIIDPFIFEDAEHRRRYQMDHREPGDWPVFDLTWAMTLEYSGKKIVAAYTKADAILHLGRGTET